MRLRDVLKGSVNRTKGPDLAQDGADQIAAMLGGKVSKSRTALTQIQYAALPLIVTQPPTVDYQAMMGDPLYAQLQKQADKLETWKQQRERDIPVPAAGHTSGLARDGENGVVTFSPLS